MVGILLNVIGIIIMGLSLLFIKRTLQHEREIYGEVELIHSEIKDYAIAMGDILNDFYELTESNLDRIENLDIDNSIMDIEPDRNDGGEEQDMSSIFIDSDRESPDLQQALYDDIISLSKIGLSNEEIAKKVNRGIREVEIIIKIWGDRRS
ncbi:MAG: hypothetical protein GX329_07395 [Tissierellia bacterium]|nr:hypothetical protein [Tissierellia bacterium]